MNLTIRNLSYRVNGSLLLDRVSIDAPEGATAVIGPNGAGKSTLINVAAGDLTPLSGSVSYGDVSPFDLNVEHRAKLRSVLSQHHSADIPFTVHQVVSMGRFPYRFDPEFDAEHELVVVEESISLLDLTAVRDRQVGSLSGGEQQRVALARVLAQRADIVFLDEPTNALDIRHQESVMSLIGRLGVQRCSVMAVLHDLNLVSHFDQVVVLHQGRVVVSGAPDDVLTTELLTAVYGHPIQVVEHPTRSGILMVPDPITGESDSRTQPAS